MIDNQYNEPLVHAHALPAQEVSMADAVKEDQRGGNDAPRKSGCRDPLFAALFVANMVIMVYFAAAHGVSALSADDEGDDSTRSAVLGDSSVSSVLGSAAAVVCTLFSLLGPFFF
jgi:hypothetical protein